MNEDAVTQGQLIQADGTALPLSSTAVHADIAGPIVRVRLQQTFRNPLSHPVDATYRFPLPAQASVQTLCFRVANRTVEARILEKETARATFEAAQAAGQTATLLEEDRPTLFTLSIAQVPGLSTIAVELEYDDLAHFDDGEWRFVFPMVAPDRYLEVPPTESGGPPLPRRRSPDRLGDVQVEVMLRDAADIRCLSHPATQHTENSHSTVTLKPNGPIPNRDFVLAWQAGNPGVRTETLFDRRPGKPTTFLITMVPSGQADARTPSAGLSALTCGNCGALVDDPTAIAEIPGIGPAFRCEWCRAILAPSTIGPVTRARRPRDVTLLVDRSASMRGAEARVTRAVRALLEGLPAGDRVRLIAFDHERTDLPGAGSGLSALSPELIEEAVEFVERTPARGGSELRAALEEATRTPTSTDHTPLIVLITDAAVGNEGKLLRELPAILGERRLFVLGTGRNLDRRLAARLAEVGGGAAQFLDGDDRDALHRFVRQVRAGGPILMGVRVRIQGAELEDLQPAGPQNLHGGQPLTVFGRTPSRGPATLVITASTPDGRPFRQELPILLPDAPPEPPAWTRSQVAALAHGRDTGRSKETADPTDRSEANNDHHPGITRLWARRQVDALYAGSQTGRSDAEAARSRALALALEHQLVSAGTSLVAVDSDPSIRSGPPPVPSPAPRRPVSTSPPAVRTSRSRDPERPAASRKAHVTPAPLPPSPPRPAPSPASTETGTQFFDPSSLVARPPGPPPMMGAPPMAGGPPRPGLPHIGGPHSTTRLPPGSFGGVPDPIIAHGPISGGAEEARPGVWARILAFFRGDTAAKPPPPPSHPPHTGFIPPAIRHPAGPPGSDGPATIEGVPRPPEPPLPPPTLLSGASHSESELRFFEQHASGALDMVFLVDETGSMGAHIQQVKNHLRAIMDAVHSSPLCRSLRIGLVTYRDHPPEDHTFASRRFELTDNFDQIRQFVDQLRAAGGGDGPESVTDGLWELARLQWRPEAARAVVWFGDAPPHGVEPSGDAFPDGCPCGDHWFTQAENCREMGITVHAVGCLPNLRSYAGAEEVFRTVAHTTGGTYVPLTEAELLVPVIVGAAETELDRQRITEHVARLVETCPAELAETHEVERVRWLTATLRRMGVQARDMGLHEDLTQPPTMSFRSLVPDDVTAALDQLRRTERLPVGLCH